ncbi:MAG: transcription antitermination factor NusB [Bdellovibrionales bacterium]|nr:transcription antitermination factor NusB [Bdellovibrionales bacterium]
MKGGRRTARELALKILYQTEFQSFSQSKALKPFLENFFEKGNYSQKEKDFCSEILVGLRDNKEVIDEKIKDYSKNWDMKRMSLVDLNIMRIAVFEMICKKDVPGKAVINEALELAKTFSGGKSPAFINGILDQVLKEVNSLERSD